MDPEFERIRGYLQSQAAAKTIDQLIEKVEEGTRELEAAASAVPAAKLAVIPEGDEWSPLDCMAHALGWNGVNAAQVLHVALTGELPSGLEEPKPGERDAMVAGHREAIDSLYEHVRAADPAANLDVRWDHPMFGPLNWREWFLFLRIHSYDHARQLQVMMGQAPVA